MRFVFSTRSAVPDIHKEDGTPFFGPGYTFTPGKDDVVRSALPGRLYDVYMHYKRDEWERYLAAVTDWERERYLDVLP